MGLPAGDIFAEGGTRESLTTSMTKAMEMVVEMLVFGMTNNFLVKT